ncbi:hypothetical protein [Neisseria viridiae]|uniref:hypothetical protein n=1 Tax=Neisseria viridiae TaxID=2830648 RepID=UPI002659193A|nr:hypothetical protein [Neisseria viridiae]
MNLKSLYLLPALLLAHSAALAAPKFSNNLKPRSAEKIIYFEQNGKFGAKTTSGKIIVPAQYNCEFMCEHGETADGELLFLDSSREIRGKVAYSPFFLHSRQGKFLHQPMMYDAAADYFFGRQTPLCFKRRQGRFCRPRGQLGHSSPTRLGRTV